MLSDISIFQIVIYFLIIQVFIVIIAFIYFRFFKRGGKRIYKAKGPYLLSAGERKYFETLSKVIGADHYICPKVRIADMVDVDIPKTDKAFWPSFNKISQKHVDFVICKKSDFSPLLIIELDGGSHNEKAQTLRDILVEKVFKDAEIPILHVKPKSFYDYKVLRDEINRLI